MIKLINEYNELEKKESTLEFQAKKLLASYKESDGLEIFFLIISFLCAAPKILFTLSLNLVLFSLLTMDDSFNLFFFSIALSIFSFAFLYFHNKSKWEDFIYKTFKIKKTKESLNFIKKHFGMSRFLYFIPFVCPAFLMLSLLTFSLIGSVFSFFWYIEYLALSKGYIKKDLKVISLPSEKLFYYKKKRRTLNKIKKEKKIIFQKIKNSPSVLDYFKNTEQLSSVEIDMKVKILQDINSNHSDEILSLYLNKEYEMINN